jgi:ABC-type long-subunit fatty acid transport system fused permease/ATPase subunit
LKFGNVILTVASIAVIEIMLDFVLGVALIPSVGSYWGMNSAAIISMLIAALFVGYIFAMKIQEESRIRATGKISVLSAAVMAFSVVMSAAANPYYKDWMEETLKSMFTTNAWTKADWYVYGQLSLMTVVVLNVVLALVLTFIGVYAGSMLRKPKKS